MKKVKSKKCKWCKELFTPVRPLQSVCSLECSIEFSKDKKAKDEKKAWAKEKSERLEKLKTKKDYEKDLEKIFNKFIRLRDKDLPCISCGKPPPFTLTAGHFFPAGHDKNLRFDEMNVHGQCWWDCNKNKHGNLLNYRLGLIDRFGEEEVLLLEQRRNIPAKYTIPELKEMIEDYKQRVKNYT